MFISMVLRSILIVAPRAGSKASPPLLILCVVAARQLSQSLDDLHAGQDRLSTLKTLQQISLL
jgi:hypothetical protein